ncbi:MAG: CHRD domain-containing protein, partial [Thermoanaerobaculia bacterium]|nr:CHRD domain-containing protein [Thermoanaerobaculia bacterium]
MKRAGHLLFALGLALAQGAWAGDAFEAVLVGTRQVPGPGMEKGSFVAVVVVEGTSVSLALTPKEVTGLVSAHLHRGIEGVAGKLIAEFPWTSADGPRRTYGASVSAKVAADLVAHPGNYYVDAHTPRFPGGAARG